MHRIHLALATLRRRLLIHRRGLAALCVALAALAGLQAFTAPAPRTVPVWSLARDVPAGVALSAADLQEVETLRGSVPAEVVEDPREVIGRTAAHALSAGHPLAPGDVLGERWRDRLGEATVVPLRISDPDVAALLRPGDRVDLLGSAIEGGLRAPSDALLLVDAARVVSVPPPADSRGATRAPGRLVLFAIPSHTVARVTAAAASQFLTVAWNR